jgi:hypothetical protein
MNHIIKALRVIIPPIAIYSILVMAMQMIFSYGNQSISQKERLTFLNFILPGLITMGFMFLALIEVFLPRINYKSNLILLLFLLILESFAVKWQYEFLIWSINNNKFMEAIPIIAGIILMLFVFLKLLIDVKVMKSINN